MTKSGGRDACECSIVAIGRPHHDAQLYSGETKNGFWGVADERAVIILFNRLDRVKEQLHNTLNPALKFTCGIGTINPHSPSSSVQQSTAQFTYITSTT
eukprot:scaffold5188_cov122-Skeletonema_marinoi.AAC.1